MKKDIDIINLMRKEKLDIYAIEDPKQKQKPPSKVFLKIDQSPKEPIFCAFEGNNILGEGSYGAVFKAKILNSNTGYHIPNQYVAIKVVPSQHFSSKEYKTASDQMATGKPVSYSGNTFLPLGFIFGAPIGDVYQNQNPILPTLTDEEKLNLAIDFLQECMEMHRKWIHRDLKGGNLLLEELSQEKRTYKIRIIDWGLALPVGNAAVIRNNRFHKNPLYHPPETKNDIWGTFTDIYMMAGVLATIFGYNNNYGPDDGALYETKFDFAGLKHLGFEQIIRECMILYLNRMRHAKYLERPNKNQPLKFFLLLKQFNKLNRLPVESQNPVRILILKTKIYLLSIGYWKDEYSQLTKKNCIKLFIDNPDVPTEIRQNIRNILTPVLSSVQNVTDQKISHPDKPKHFFMIARYVKDDKDTIKMLTINVKNPQAATCLGYPAVEYYATYEQALDKLKTLKTTGDNRILGFRCPTDEGPGEEYKHISIENLFDPKHPSPEFTASSPADNKEKNNSTQSIEEKRLNIPKNSDSKNSSQSHEQSKDKFETQCKDILKTIVQAIENLPEYKGNDAEQISVGVDKRRENPLDFTSGVRTKSVEPRLATIYSQIFLISKDNFLKDFRVFRTKALQQIAPMKNFTLFKSSDLHAGELIGNLLGSTLKEERRINQSQPQSITLGSSNE